MTESTTGQTAELNREHNWRDHFERWRQSGLTQSEYCRQAQSSRHRFKYWRRKLEPSEVRPRKWIGYTFADKRGHRKQSDDKRS